MMSYASSGWCASVACRQETALVLVDVIHDFQYPGGDELLAYARPMAERLGALKQRSRRLGVPAIYVNETSDYWKPSFSRQVDQCLADGAPGRPVVELLRPDRQDYFLLKTQHSPCFLMNLDGLLGSLQVKTLIVAGLASNICTLLAMGDFFLSGFRLIIPDDCVASKTPQQTRSALRQLRQLLGAEIMPSTDLFFGP